MKSIMSKDHSDLQTTFAALMFQWSSQTVPQVPLWRISTRPEVLVVPLTSLIVAVCVHTSNRFSLVCHIIIMP